MKTAMLFVFLALLLPALAPAEALARDIDLQARRVSYADIDTATDAGADRLLRRLRHAARGVCAVHDGAAPLADRALDRACKRAAMDDALAQLGLPRVSQRYAAQRARDPALALAER